MKLIIKVLKFSKFKNTEIDIHSYKFNYIYHIKYIPFIL